MLLAEHHLELLSLKGGCTGSSESTHVKMLHCWKSHAVAHLDVDSGPRLHTGWDVAAWSTLFADVPNLGWYGLETR